MFDAPPNYLAVLVAALVPMIVGSLWYSKLLFGEAWLRAMGWSESEMAARHKSAGPAYAGSFVAALVESYVLAHFASYLALSGALEGAVLGFWIWLGFTAATAAASVLFEGRSRTGFLINTGYNLVSLILMGALLAAWQ